MRDLKNKHTTSGKGLTSIQSRRGKSFGYQILGFGSGVAAGAEYIVSQMFFDNSQFIKFVKQCRKAGINVPIIPGLKILATVKQLSSIPKNFYVDLPDDLVDEVNENPNHVKEIGQQWGYKQCEDLLNNGVQSIHFYIMNNATPILEIVDRLNK